MFGAEWWAHALGWGAVAAATTGAVLTAVLFIAPYTFLNDYPDDIKEAARPPSRVQRRASLVAGIVFMIALLASIGAVVFSWGTTHPDAGFLELASMALIAILLFVVVDILVLDWLIICTWRPRAILIPGTEDCAGWRDYGHHFREQFRPRGLLVLVIGSALIGGLAWWLT